MTGPLLRSALGLLALAFVATAALAQAGSTGGTIGKQGKSVSGGEEPRSPALRNGSQRPIGRQSNAPETLPKTIQLNDRTPVGDFFVTLQKVGGNVYQGTWNHGYVTKFTVTGFTSETMTMERNDNPALGAVTGTYSGQRAGNRAIGNAACSNGIKSNWDASW
ncbi:MAG: hypothetical protein HY659_12545 [Rhizobiales bacterium]|nr:hypothetical protein [Hyphomicrobiales bacterium]